MPIYKFIDPKSNVIIEQYRDSILDMSPFIDNEIEYKLYQILPDKDFLDQNKKDIIYNPLCINAIRAIVGNEEKDRIDFLHLIFSYLDEKDINYIINNVQFSSYTYEKNDVNLDDISDYKREEFISKFTNLKRNEKLRKEIFGKEEVEVTKSEQANRDKRIKSTAKWDEIRRKKLEILGKRNNQSIK